MRSLILAIIILTGICAVALAQGQGVVRQKSVLEAPKKQLPKLNPFKNAVDWVLVKWEKAMANVQSLEADCVRLSEDIVFRKKTTFKGKAKYLKLPNASLASLELKMEGREQVFEKYICTGRLLYQFDPTLKVVKVIDMPKGAAGQVAGNNFQSFLFGMKAAEAKQRYHLRYIPPKKEDKWYYYIEIRPKLAKDKADFTRARLVLFRKNFMPAQLWFEEPNRNSITWNFQNLKTPAQLSALEFQNPTLPPGWKMQRMPSLNQPRILRNQE